MPKRTGRSLKLWIVGYVSANRWIILLIAEYVGKKVAPGTSSERYVETNSLGAELLRRSGANLASLPSESANISASACLTP